MSEQLNNLATIHYGKSPSEVLEEDGPFPIIGTGGRYGQAKKAMFNGPSVVVARKGSLGNPQLLMEPFWPADTTYAVIPAKDVDASWLYYNLLNFDLTKLNEATGVPSISRDWLNKIRFFNPSRDHKRRIGEILQAVDDVIEKTEVLIAKYQQIKAGLMHDLFTRGVTADGKLRPSREQAPELYKETPIGWIPKEWAFTSVESLLDRIIDYRGKTPTKTEDGIPLITAKNVRMGYIDPEPREFIAARDYPIWMTRGIPVHSDVVFTTEAPLGNVAQIGTNDRVAFAQRVIILQAGSCMLPNFLRLLLMSETFQRSALRLSSGSTALGIKQSEFRKIMVGHPVQLDEQQFISDKLIALENYEALGADKVKKLLQQKSGLMSDLLTGRVHVPVNEAEGEML